MEQQNEQPTPSTSTSRRKDDAVIADIHRRLNQGDMRFDSLEANLKINTEATQQIAENTAGMIRLANELEAGTKLMCRVALGVRFVLKEIVDPYWKPALVVSAVFYYMTHDHQLPDWIGAFLKVFAG